MAFKGNQFFAADLHFEHPGIVKERNGIRMRPFETVEEHDEAVIERWNAKVGVNDKVYILGDVAMKKAGLAKVSRLNGKKHLIKGNHDIFELHDYTPLFYQISAYRVFVEFSQVVLASHMPVHPMELDRFKFNVHGHLHDKRVRRKAEDGRDTEDLRYLCVSLEHTNYAPISMDEVMGIRSARAL